MFLVSTMGEVEVGMDCLQDGVEEEEGVLAFTGDGVENEDLGWKVFFLIFFILFVFFFFFFFVGSFSCSIKIRIGLLVFVFGVLFFLN